MDKEFKKVSFRIDVDTFNDLQQEAEKQYLSVSAYIRKQLDKELYKEGNADELQ